MKPIPLALAWLMVLGPEAPVRSQSAPPSDRPANLILITIDTLRADRLSAYGYPRRTSPNLDRFMSRGTRFEWAFSAASYTAPSHITLMTGLYPSLTSVMLDNGRFFKLAGKTVTLAELCRDKGMRTAAVVSNPTLNRRLGLHQGFAIYADLQFDRANERYIPKDAATTTQEALEILEQVHDAPFFMWIHYQDPHGPYTPPMALEPFADTPSADREQILTVGTDTSGYQSIPIYQVLDDERAFSQYSLRYDNEILYLDGRIEALFARVEALGLLKNTLIVLTSDHGEAFAEDDFFFAHSHSVGLDQVHVPLAIVGPGVRSGVALKSPVGAVDVFATMVAMLDLPPLPKAPGRPLVETLRRGAEPPRKPIFCEGFSQRGVVLNDLYYRCDRRPADSPIWKISPTTNGRHLPLGPQLVRLADRAVLDVAQGAALAAELDAFSLQAEQAICVTFDEMIRRPKDERTIAENNGLVFFRDQLGYDFDLKDLQPVKAEELSPEEKAQRRAVETLGYLEKEPAAGGDSPPPPEGPAGGTREPKP